MAPVATSAPSPEVAVSANGKPHKTHTYVPPISDDEGLQTSVRGNPEGTLRLAGIPNFQGDRYAERDWVKAHLAGAFRYWAKNGYAEGCNGHITARDPVLPDHYWMNAFGIHFGDITVSNLVLVGPNGYVAPDGAQLPINIAGYYIHASIHEARPDVNAAAHCHSIYGKTWSVFGQPLDLITQDSTIFHNNHSVYKSFGGIVRSNEEGKRIAAALGPTNMACIMQNHGLLTCGQTVDECAFLFTTMEKCCQTQLMVEAACAAGLKKTLIDPVDAAFSAATLASHTNGYVYFQPDYELLLKETDSAFLK